jgi:hypothetical protein
MRQGNISSDKWPRQKDRHLPIFGSAGLTTLIYALVIKLRPNS